MSLFITFEGIEGSGKSTHARTLAAYLRRTGRTVVETREPGGTAAGMAIRRLLLGSDATPLTPLAELLLYCADRAQHVAEVITPALAAGAVVVCDRFFDSTIAYQGYARGVDLDLVRALDAHARRGVAPALTFLLDCPVQVGLARAKARGAAGDRFERETVAFHERICGGFHRLAASAPDRIVVVDSTVDGHTVEQRIVAETESRLGNRP
ncbi:MAG: dTMP kinase [Candidatus Binatia bacterium]